MFYLADRTTAVRVLSELRDARFGERTQVLACLQRLRNEAASERVDDLPRVQAWLAIRTLYDAFKTSSDRDLKPLWQDAINKTTTWRDSLH